MPPRVDAFQNGSIAADTLTQSAAFPVDDDIGRLQLVITRAALSGSSERRDLVDVKMEVSFDSGVIWEKFGGFTLAGGVHFGRDGGIQPFSSFTVRIPVGVSRMVRVNTLCAERATVVGDIDQII